MKRLSCALVLASFLIGTLPLRANEVADKIVGTWKGSIKEHFDVANLQFKSGTFKLQVDPGPDYRPIYECTITGSYQVNSKNELIVTPVTIGHGAGECELIIPEFVKDKELNLGTVELSSNDSNLLVYGGRIHVTRTK
jgi:hypothetical protein